MALQDSPYRPASPDEPYWPAAASVCDDGIMALDAMRSVLRQLAGAELHRLTVTVSGAGATASARVVLTGPPHAVATITLRSR